jgi:hypothetical protein
MNDMNAQATPFSRADLLRALGVTPLRLRPRPWTQAAAPPAEPQAAIDKRLALAPRAGDMDAPALAALYTKIGEAITSLGLQCVRIADAEADPRVRVLAFGDPPLPPAIDAGRVLRVDALAVLHADRGRKRALWDRLQELVQERR